MPFPRDGGLAGLLDNARPADWRNPEPASCYDLVVIGGGPAGLRAAEVAIDRGAKVALIERHLLGGVSVQSGSVPSKAMLRTGKLYADMRDARRYGGQAPDQVQPDFAAAMEHMRCLRSRISESCSAARLSVAGVDLFFGAARFQGPDSITLDGSILRFGKALIATGARPAQSDIPGLMQARFLTSNNVFDLRECPKRLLVIGGGPQGCEMAQAFCRFGAHVVFVQRRVKLLPREEREAAQIVSDALSRDGIEMRLNTGVLAIRKNGAGEKEADLVSAGQQSTVTVDEILVNVGRIANVKGLNLGAAGVCGNEARGIEVDAFLQTGNRNIYAAGDVCLADRFTAAAIASAEVAVENALGSAGRNWHSVVVPWCTYTDPELATVGIRPKEARARTIPVTSVTIMMNDNDRAVVDGRADGFVKIHLREGTDEILGATIVGTRAGEMITEITLAMEARIGLRRLASVIHTYPTEGNAIKMAADAFVKSDIEPAPRDIANPAWPSSRKLIH